MARKRGTFRIFYNGLDPSGTGNPGTAWVTGRGFGAFQRPVNTVQQLISYIMSLNPVAYWPLNDHAGSLIARDITGNGYDGIVNGGVTFGSAGLTGFGETSAAFTGYAGAPISVPNFPSFAGDISVIYIFKTALPDTTSGQIISQGNFNVSGFTSGINVTGGLPTSVSFYQMPNGENPVVAYALANNCVALTRKGNTVTNVTNGTTASVSGAFAAGTSGLNIGGPANPYTELSSTSLAHIAIFPYALTAAQITALQNFITAGPVANFGGMSDAAVGPMGALSIGGPARASKGYGLVAAAASVNGTYDYLPVAGQTMPPGSTAINVTADSPLAWYEPPNSATQIAGPNPPVGFLLSTTIPKERVFFILSY